MFRRGQEVLSSPYWALQRGSYAKRPNNISNAMLSDGELKHDMVLCLNPDVLSYYQSSYFVEICFLNPLPSYTMFSVST